VTAGSTPLARVIVWAGEIPREVELGNFRPRFPDRPLDLVIGSVDEYATWVNVGEQRHRLDEAGLTTRLHIFDGGHRLDRETLRALAANAPGVDAPGVDAPGVDAPGVDAP
ncbi:MAG: hypothetical protein ABIZ91_08565, partial [Gemmatimonadaceae bacterium]